MIQVNNFLGLSKNNARMKKIILLFYVLGIYNSSAQTIDSIEADRPDQTETPSLVPVKMFQIETGFTYQKEDSELKTFLLPTVLWKYGANENFELRMITEFNYVPFNTENQFGFSSVLIGLKAKLAEEKGILPKTSIIAHISLPNAAATRYKTDFFAPQFRFTMQHTLSDVFSLSYNLGAEWNGFSAEPQFIYTLASGYSITEKLGSYMELFGFLPQKNKANHNFDTGLTYLINNNFMLDVSSGIGLTDNAPKYYISAGFSFRI